MQQLALSLGEQVVAVFNVLVLQLTNIVFHQHAADGRTKKGLTLTNRADGVDEIRFGRFLQQVAASPCLEGAKHIAFVGMHTQHDDRHARLPGGDLARSLDAIHVGHGDIQHRDVRFEGLRQSHRLPTVAGLADHLKILLFFQNQAQPAPHYSMIFRQNDSNHTMPLSEAGPPPASGK